jgi:hypothetical protein
MLFGAPKKTKEMRIPGRGRSKATLGGVICGNTNY